MSGEDDNPIAQRNRKFDEDRKMAMYLSICPALYADTDEAKLPDREAAARVTAWRFQHKGIAMMGPSRTGKSRTAWMLVKKLILAGRRVRCFDSIRWSSEVVRASCDEGMDEFLVKACNCDAMFVDDLFKARMTETQELGAYGLMERMAQLKKPLFITTNSTAQTIRDSATEAGAATRIEPIIERIKEFMTVIVFKRSVR